MPCNALRSPTDRAAEAKVPVMGYNKSSNGIWKVGDFSLVTAQELVLQWHREQLQCVYWIRYT